MGAVAGSDRRESHRSHVLTGALVSCALVFGSHAAAEDAFDMLRYAPPDAILAASWSGGDAVAEAFKKTHVFQLSQVPGVRAAFVQAARGLWFETAYEIRSRTSTNALAIVELMLSQAWRRPGLFYICPPDDASERRPWIEFVMLQQLDAAAGEELVRILERRGTTAPAGDGPEARNVPTGRISRRVPLHAGYSNSLAVLAFGQDAVQQAARGDDRDTSFVDSPRFERARAAIGDASPFLFISADSAPLARLAWTAVADAQAGSRSGTASRPSMRTSEAAFRDVFSASTQLLTGASINLRAFDAWLGLAPGCELVQFGSGEFACTLSVQGPNIRCLTYDRADPATPWPQDFLRRNPVDVRAILQRIPDDAIACEVGSLVATDCFGAIVRVLADLGGFAPGVPMSSPAETYMQQCVASLDKELGIDTMATIVDQIGSHYVVYSPPHADSPAIAVELRDRTMIRRHLRRTAEAFPSHQLEVERIGDASFYIVRVTSTAMTQVPICFAATDDYFVMSVHSTSARRMLKHLQDPSGSSRSMAGNKRIRELLAPRNVAKLTAFGWTHEQEWFKPRAPVVAACLGYFSGQIHGLFETFTGLPLLDPRETETVMSATVREEGRVHEVCTGLPFSSLRGYDARWGIHDVIDALLKARNQRQEAGRIDIEP